MFRFLIVGVGFLFNLVFLCVSCCIIWFRVNFLIKLLIFLDYDKEIFWNGKLELVSGDNVNKNIYKVFNMFIIIFNIVRICLCVLKNKLNCKY